MIDLSSMRRLSCHINLINHSLSAEEEGGREGERGKEEAGSRDPVQTLPPVMRRKEGRKEGRNSPDRMEMGECGR